MDFVIDCAEQLDSAATVSTGLSALLLFLLLTLQLCLKIMTELLRRQKKAL
jgi:hypothetical protein